MPVISLFGCGYFYFKYIGDKYNLVFTYFNKHEFGGRIRTSVKNFMLGNIFVYMFVMVSFFGYKFPEMPFYWIGIAITIAWAALYYAVASNQQNEVVQDIMVRIGVFKENKPNQPGNNSSFSEDLQEHLLDVEEEMD